MRKFSIVFATLLCYSSYAQIIITSADMPVVGDTFHALRDPLPLPPGFTIGASGANQTWDFSNLSGTVPVTAYAVAPASTPYAADFPNANIALTYDHVGYAFNRTLSTALKNEGLATIDASLGTITLNYSPIPDQYRFPTTYPNNFSGTFGFQEAKPYNQLPANIQQQIDAGLTNCFNPAATVQQVRVTMTGSYTDDIDGWGKVITPLGTYDALRRKRVEITQTVIDVYTNCFFSFAWLPILTLNDTTTDHSWLSNITKLPVVSLTYDSSRTITEVTYSLIPPPPVAGFTWDNSSGGTVDFTNISQNSPATYDWDFGDGGSSDLENPSHDYAANGSYHVCLTVTNESGNNTFCDTVTVSGIVSDVTVSGKILSELGAKVKSTKLEATGSSPQSMVTDTSGSYSFIFNAGDSITIAPFKNNDTTNGITTLDIIFIQKQILVIQPLPLNTPLKMIAADVNASKSITTLDIVFIRSVILRVNPTFPGGKVWSFVPSDYQFADSTSPFVFPQNRTYNNISTNWTGQDFTGVKLGDVNNSWVAANAKTATAGDVQFRMDDYNALPGDEVTVPVRVRDFNNITGYQCTISWDTEVLEFAGVNNQSLNGFFGTTRTGDGYLTTSWNDEWANAVALEDDAVAFELKFRVTGQKGSSSEIKINSDLTEGEAYNENLDLLNIVPKNGLVKVGNASSFVNRNSSIANLTVQPNPFSNSTQIVFDLTEDEAVTIAVFDLLGKQVSELSGNFKAGEHRVDWNGTGDAGQSLKPGAYLLKLLAGTSCVTEKMLLLK